ncbi:hypothetical protein NOVO_08205 [Rickettsiales bacterium Ac37b]|nr:hypothetical protein NOVO_08205 [Rickettsiales bacterium Ac37b]
MKNSNNNMKFEEGVKEWKNIEHENFRKKVIKTYKNIPSPLRNFVHDMIDTIFFLPIGEKYRDYLHYAAINIFNVAERNRHISLTMIGGSIAAMIFQQGIEKLFTMTGTIITEAFSIIGAIVTVTGEGLGSIYALPLVGLMGALGGYAVASKIANGCVYDPVLEKQYKDSLGIIEPVLNVAQNIANNLNIGITKEKDLQTSHVRRLIEERNGQAKDQCIIS